MTMKEVKPRRNTPIAQLIKNYRDKKSGKVSAARNEIQWRFDALDWRHQKQILPDFLRSGKGDRNWVSRQMFTHWDDSFIPVVKDVWEQYHETPLSWVVIRYLPIDYIKANMDVLSAGRNYFFICKRLINDSEFRVDKERLYESDYLSLMILKKCEIWPAMVWGLFYTQMRKICLGEYKTHISDLTFYSERGTTLISIFNCSIVKSILRTIEHDLHMFEIYKQLNEWIDRVSKAVMKSREWFLIKNYDLPYMIPEKMGLILMRKYCYEHLEVSFRIKGVSVDTRQLDELLKKLEVIDSLGRTKDELEEKGMFTPSLINLIHSFDLVKTDECPF